VCRRRKGDPREQCERNRSLTVIVPACRQVAELCLMENMHSRSQSSGLPCCMLGASFMCMLIITGQHLILHWTAFSHPCTAIRPMDMQLQLLTHDMYPFLVTIVQLDVQGAHTTTSRLLEQICRAAQK
jgi:hypothetical protein